MKDERAMAYVNLFAVLGAMSPLCRLDEEAAQIAKSAGKISIGFRVSGGPCGTLAFENGACEMREGADGADILLPFSGPDKFNAMIDGKYTPVPHRGFTRLRFLLKGFQRLTELLPRYLRESEADLRSEAFFLKSTEMMFFVIANAAAQLGNEDPVARASASYIVDGAIRLAIQGGPEAAICAENHRLRAVMGAPEAYLSFMEFESMRLARDLFDGRVNSVVCVGLGKIRMGGMISQIDNVNRILDRVAAYLA